jgi:hypothetical protein
MQIVIQTNVFSKPIGDKVKTEPSKPGELNESFTKRDKRLEGNDSD